MANLSLAMKTFSESSLPPVVQNSGEHSVCSLSAGEAPPVPSFTRCEPPVKAWSEKEKDRELLISKELIETIIGFVSNEPIEANIESEKEINVLKIFITQASHRKSDPVLLSQIGSMNVGNYRQVLKKLSYKVNRHRKNENIRTVMTILHKFVRNENSQLKSTELEPFRKSRYSELKIVEQCMATPEFHKRLIGELQSSSFRHFCKTQLTTQLASYLLPWSRFFLQTGKWKARFVAFPLEVEHATEFFSLITK